MNRSGPKKILLVNDDRREMATLSQIILLNGYQLLYADDKDRALKVLKKARPDLIICSEGSSKLDVVGLFKSVKSVAQTRSIPFLFITECKERMLGRIGSLHPDSLLVSPFTREQLAITVQKNLRK